MGCSLVGRTCRQTARFSSGGQGFQVHEGMVLHGYCIGVRDSGGSHAGRVREAPGVRLGTAVGSRVCCSRCGVLRRGDNRGRDAAGVPVFNGPARRWQHADRSSGRAGRGEKSGLERGQECRRNLHDHAASSPTGGPGGTRWPTITWIGLFREVPAQPPCPQPSSSPVLQWSRGSRHGSTWSSETPREAVRVWWKGCATSRRFRTGWRSA